MPQALQLLLQRIERRQRPILRQQRIQAAPVGVLERAAIGPQQEAAALDGLLPGQTPERLGRLELGAAAVADHVAEQPHDVKAVEDDGGMGRHRPEISRAYRRVTRALGATNGSASP